MTDEDEANGSGRGLVGRNEEGGESFVTLPLCQISTSTTDIVGLLRGNTISKRLHHWLHHLLQTIRIQTQQRPLHNA